MYPKKIFVNNLQHQKGFLLPLALFILVVMGLLALTISRTSMQTQMASVQELMTVQAFYAGESGAQRGMQALFFTNVNRRDADIACRTMAINRNFAGINGLQACNVRVTCACRYRDNTVCNDAIVANYTPTAAVGVSASFYTLTSTGACGQLQDASVRTIQVGAFWN